MLRSLRAMENYKVNAVDGDVGKAIDFFFDDDDWAVRYLVVDTSGFWEASHQVLIAPNAFRQADGQSERIDLSLTRDKVKNSPTVDLAKPVSRQYEREYFTYYNWPYYWERTVIEAEMLAGVGSGAANAPSDQGDTESVDPHLHAVRDVAGYNIHGNDEEFGRVQDFIIDDENWEIRYLVVDTSRWWFGKSVLVAPRWIDRIDWASKRVYVNLPREVIKNSPEWNPEEAVNREYEVRLYDYYGRPAYWLNEDGSKPPSRRGWRHQLDSQDPV